ncbi:HU family DNA-binding protein [Acaryochloris sp. IP29b_bin.148]|nr:HU family DNA-binding protein [Acaryochloris sp. IP29b_bin.148]
MGARDRNARDGHNPQLGKKFKILAAKAPVFIADDGFKEKIKS